MSAELDALVARRDELERQHGEAVAKLETDGTRLSRFNLNRCGEIFDELAAVQRRIDARLAAERAR